MSDTYESSITNRIERLERQNRLFKSGIVLAVLCVSSLFVMGQAQAPLDIIEAQGFVLVDGEGTKRAELSFNLSSEPRLRFHRLSGEQSLNLDGGEPPNLTMYSSGSRVAEVSIVGGAAPQIMLSGDAPIGDAGIIEDFYTGTTSVTPGGILMSPRDVDSSIGIYAEPKRARIELGSAPLGGGGKLPLRQGTRYLFVSPMIPDIPRSSEKQPRSPPRQARRTKRPPHR